MADDDEDDCLLLKEAFQEGCSNVDLRFVDNGEELMNYLYRRNGYSDGSLAPWPDLILLDLNMPAKDGREALKEIKSQPNLRRTPVIILTTSREVEDVLLTYDIGASSYIAKPTDFDEWGELAKAISLYWFKFSTLPPNGY
jgi:CheY-like chemotaxis protein